MNFTPVVPLRDIVIFPNMVVPLFVGRLKSVKALNKVDKDGGYITLLSQKKPEVDNPSQDDMYQSGVHARLMQMLRLPDGTVKVLVEAVERVTIKKIHDEDDYLYAETTPIDSLYANNNELEALRRSLISSFGKYVKLNKKVAADSVGGVEHIDDIHSLIDHISAAMLVSIEDKQLLLSLSDVFERIEKTLGILEREIGVLDTEKRIRSRVRNQMEKSQKEYYLNEQMKAIQKELGDIDNKFNEADQFAKRISETKLSKEAEKQATAELKKFKAMNPMSSEATVVRNYLDWILDLPWQKFSKSSNNIDKAQKVLDNDHAGLEKVKERIIEHLAVQKKTGQLKGPILCLVGPPGVGKTSLARSIAKATGRNLARMSLGGVRDESEIRGHRRTYIGAMPGKIVQNLKKVGTSNPLFLLDEIDKMGQDFRGDPASALLEVLDPEQNAEFGDHYLEVNYDLSDVMFVTTANSLNLPRPLLDRMEIIHISGYTEYEKLEIARNYLLVKQLDKHGAKDGEISITDDAILKVIRYYTRESGVRNLERQIAKVIRKCTTAIVKDKVKSIAVEATDINKYLGVEKYDFNSSEEQDNIGMTTGLAYTETGGDTLPIEAAIIAQGSGKITLTGKLGDVMQESAQTAWSYVRSRAFDFGIRAETFRKNDIHVHVPDGAVPKDGPSAGGALATTIVSALTNNAVRKDVAMTGEINLRGQITPIGGLREKLLAAQRSGIKTVLIPKRNEKDLTEIPDNAKDGLNIIAVNSFDDVLKHALIDDVKPIEYSEFMVETLTDKSPLAH